MASHSWPIIYIYIYNYQVSRIGISQLCCLLAEGASTVGRLPALRPALPTWWATISWPSLAVPCKKFVPGDFAFLMSIFDDLCILGYLGCVEVLQVILAPELCPNLVILLQFQGSIGSIGHIGKIALTSSLWPLPVFEVELYISTCQGAGKMPRMDCLWLCAMCSRKPWLLQMATFQISFRLGEVMKQYPCWWFFGWLFHCLILVVEFCESFCDLVRLAQVSVKPEDAPAWCKRTKDQLNPHWDKTDKTHFQIFAEGGTVHFPVARPWFAAWTAAASQMLAPDELSFSFVFCFLNHSKIRSPSPFTSHKFVVQHQHPKKILK